jgi:hypothetical protein
MSFSIRPCAQCGNTTFHYMPNMQIQLTFMATLLGMQVAEHMGGRFWSFTLVICDQCGLSQTFTNNGPQLAQWVPGSNTISAPTG